jgi:hypothetical protein
MAYRDVSHSRQNEASRIVCGCNEMRENVRPMRTSCKSPEPCAILTVFFSGEDCPSVLPLLPEPLGPFRSLRILHA